MTAHVKMEAEKKFKCKICEYAATKNCYLKTHVTAMHMMEKPFKCEECGRNFSDKSNMRKHARVIHQHIKDFHCDQPRGIVYYRYSSGPYGLMKHSVFELLFLWDLKEIEDEDC